MDPLVQVAAVSGLVAVIVAWISRPTFSSQRRLKKIEGEFTTNGGTSAKDALNRIETGLNNVRGDVAHLTGRFDQHIADNGAAARREGTQMWQAVEAIAKSDPPQEGDR